MPVKPQRYLEDQTVGGKLLGKTMKFVSGMFNRDACDESSESDRQIKGKGKVIDRDSDLGRQLENWEEERFKEFGKELPKAWQIEEAGLDTDATSMTPIPMFGFSSPEPTKKGSQVGVGPCGLGKDQGMGSRSDIKDVLRGCNRDSWMVSG